MNKLFVYNRHSDSCIFYHEWRAATKGASASVDSFGRKAAKSVRSIFSFSSDLEKTKMHAKTYESPISKSVSLIGDMLPNLTRSFARSKLSLSEDLGASPSVASIEIGEQCSVSSSDLASEQDLEDLENKKQLVYGVAFTIDGIIQKLAPNHQDSFVGYKASNYAMHHFLAPTGYRFILIAEANSTYFASGRKLLIAIYEGCFLKYFCLNSLQALSDCIQPENSKFKDALMSLLNKRR